MSDPSQEEPFFIGWEAKPAPPICAFLKKTTLLVVAAALVIAGAVTAMQQTVVTTAIFDFGNVREFAGLLVKSPAPMLIADPGTEEQKIYYLVSPFKQGFPVETAEQNHLKQVTLMGTFIGDELDSMIEVEDGSISVVGNEDGALEESAGTAATVRGEIVDSKCHLGVMNPGRFKPHRACAIQCITGGIPPILVARTADGQFAHYLLVGVDGSAINEAVLEFVAEPVEVSGTLKTIGERKVLYINPETITRL